MKNNIKSKNTFSKENFPDLTSFISFFLISYVILLYLCCLLTGTYAFLFSLFYWSCFAIEYNKIFYKLLEKNLN